MYVCPYIHTYCAVSDGSLQPVSPNNVIVHGHAKYQIIPWSCSNPASPYSAFSPCRDCRPADAGLSMFLCCKATLHGRHVGRSPCISGTIIPPVKEPRHHTALGPGNRDDTGLVDIRETYQRRVASLSSTIASYYLQQWPGMSNSFEPSWRDSKQRLATCRSQG